MDLLSKNMTLAKDCVSVAIIQNTREKDQVEMSEGKIALRISGALISRE